MPTRDEIRTAVAEAIIDVALRRGGHDALAAADAAIATFLRMTAEPSEGMVDVGYAVLDSDDPTPYDMHRAMHAKLREEMGL